MIPYSHHHVQEITRVHKPEIESRTWGPGFPCQLLAALFTEPFGLVGKSLLPVAGKSWTHFLQGASLTMSGADCIVGHE